jgi:RNA polymerase sigma factor (sigma-70 family)
MADDLAPAQPPTSDPIQDWLTRHNQGLNPPVEDLCRYCQQRIKELVRPRLRSFPNVRREVQTTDVLDDVLMRLLAAIKEVQLGTVMDLNCLVARIIRRVLLDRLRKIQRDMQRFSELPSDILIDTDMTAGLDIDTMAAFHEYIDNLGSEEASLFDLLYYQGKSFEEAAKQLGIPKTTLRRNWAKSRDKMQAAFNKYLNEM